MSETTYATDDDVKNRDRFATRFLTPDDVDDEGAQTFERFRLLARDQIDADLANREPPIAGIACKELRDVEVLLVLAHGYRESASSGGDADLFMKNAESFEEKAGERLQAYRGSADEDDPGSFGGSIPFERC